MKTQVIASSDPLAIPAALETLARGGLVAFPTDTVYGVAARIDDPAAIDKLYQIKHRSANKAIAILLANIAQAAQVTPGLTPLAMRLAQAFWPGALTLVVPKAAGLPENISIYPTIGIRIPDLAFTLRLLEAAGPLPVTSANISGANSASTGAEVLEQLDGAFDLLIDGGQVPGGVSSTVVDCTSAEPVILREGGLPSSQILAMLQGL